MAVGLKVRSNLWVVGTSDFLFAFFSTIRVRLETEGWGSRFPTVMNELYAGELVPERAPAALAELDQIRAELRRLPPSALVWDAEDLSEPAPREVLDGAGDLAGCFVREGGGDVFDAMGEALAYSARCGHPARVQRTLVPTDGAD
jgi:2,3-bisphosphoglycerate-dependent phosphoglycerate mutase